jgi:spore maturation protein CgeB
MGLQYRSKRRGQTVSDPQLQSTLQSNLQAISTVNPALALRISEPDLADHLKKTPDGKTLFFYGRVPRILDLQDKELPKVTGFAPAGAEIVLAGIGLGEAVESALNAPHSIIRAWERDPSLLKMALSRYDWSARILSGRLVLYLGVDCVHIPRAAIQTLWAHPALEGIYAIEMPLLRNNPRARRALICAGELFVKDIAEALEEQGYSVYTWDIERLSIAELKGTARVFKPEIAFAINFAPDLSEACQALDLPLAIWEIDPDTSFFSPCKQPQPETHIFTYRKSRVEMFKSAGFPNTIAMPLAANTDRRKPQPADHENTARFRSPLSFVGTSMVPTALAFQERFRTQIAKCYPNSDSTTAFDLQEAILLEQRKDFCQWKIPDLLEARAPGFRTECEGLGLDDPTVILGEMAASEKRLTCIATLGHLGIQVWGDVGWKHIEKHGAVHRGYAGHFKELNHIYSQCQVNVDIGRIYQSDIVPMRIFDILACGGFVLAEYTEALDDLFEIGEEIEVWRTIEELQDKAAYFLNHPKETRNIALAGRARVCRDHRIKDRVDQMLQAVLGARKAKTALTLVG